jgi:hypothetical protein
VNLFRKSEPAPAAGGPSTAVALYQPPVQPSAAPKASDLERQIRAVIWQHISPVLAHAAGLSLPELIDWTSGVSRLTTPQIEALARHIGLIDTPVTGIDKIRARLVVELKRAQGFGRLDWPGGGKGEDDLRSFIAGENCLTYGELNRLAKEFWQNVELDPETAELKSTAPPATSVGVRPPQWTSGSNVPWINEKAISRLQTRLRQLEALA